MNLMNLILLLNVIIGTVIFIYGKNHNNDYVVLCGSLLLSLAISVGSFILLYNIINIVLSISTAVVIFGLMLIVVEVVSRIDGLAVFGLGLVILSIFTGFITIGITVDLNNKYQKIEDYEQCKIGGKYFTFYKDYKLITDQKPNNVYLETPLNAYGIELDDRINLTMEKEE